MDRNYDQIELGVVSSDTKGAVFDDDDHENGYQLGFLGLSAD